MALKASCKEHRQREEKGGEKKVETRSIDCVTLGLTISENVATSVPAKGQQ